MAEPIADAPAEPVVHEERILPWITVLWTTIASLLLSAVRSGIAALTWSPLTGWNLLPGTWFGFETQAWFGLRFGLGLVIADRLAPKHWPRPVRWAVGGGLGALAMVPSNAWTYVQAIIEGVPQADRFMQSLPWRITSAVTAACFSYWVGRMLTRDESRPVRTGARSGLDAGIVLGLVGIPWTVWHFYVSASEGFDLPGGLLFWLGLLLAQSAVSGLADGLAIGLGLSMGRRVVRDGARPTARRVGVWFRDQIDRIFS